MDPLPRVFLSTYYVSGPVQAMLGEMLSSQSARRAEDGDKRTNNYRLMRQDVEPVTQAAEHS